MRIYFILLGLLFSAPVFASDYFQAMYQIQETPDGYIAVLPCDLAEKKQIVTMLTSDKKYAQLKLDEEGRLTNGFNEQVEIYKGYFSNDGVLEYALVTTGGTMHANTVEILKPINHQLVDAHLDQSISKHLLAGSDMSRFYLHVANPFAIIKNGKTYLRFMEFPYKEYDKKKLLLCTYLWEGEKITLTGPNLSFTGPNDSLVEAKTAAIRKSNSIKEPYCYEALQQ